MTTQNPFSTEDLGCGNPCYGTSTICNKDDYCEECDLKMKERQRLKAIVEKDWIEKKEVEEIIDKTKLPEDKNYRYSNEYIDAWINELKQKLGLLEKEK